MALSCVPAPIYAVLQSMPVVLHILIMLNILLQATLLVLEGSFFFGPTMQQGVGGSKTTGRYAVYALLAILASFSQVPVCPTYPSARPSSSIPPDERTASLTLQTTILWPLLFTQRKSRWGRTPQSRTIILCERWIQPRISHSYG